MPSAIKLNHELASKGLVSIMVESQGSDEAGLRAFMAHRFPDCDCFTTVHTFVPIPDSNGIPHGAVIGVDGTLLWCGNPAAEGKKIEDLVAAELVKVKKGWGASSEAKKVRAALYGKGEFATAAAIVATMADGDEKTQLQAEIDKRYAIAKKSIAALQQQGMVIEAQSAAKQLLKDVTAKAEWAAEVTPILADFDSDANKAEIALEKKLDKIIKQVRDKKADGAPKALKALLKNGANTKVGERAETLMKALETEVKA